MSPLSLELGLGALGLLLLLVEAFARVPRKLLAYAGIGGLLVALVALCCGGPFTVPESLAGLYSVDRLAMFYKSLALVATIATLVLSLEYAPVINQFVSKHPERTQEAGLGEFFSLPIFVCVGMMVMASAKDLITIFVALELVTVSFYVLVAFMRRSAMSLEAGVKYLILGALSTGLLVYGIAWLYGTTGQLTLEGIADQVAHWEGSPVPLLFAAALLIAGLGFKVGAVPFHIWIPDVYQGAPTPVSAFLSVGSKAAGFVVLSRIVEVFLAKGSVIAEPVTQLLLLLGAATILIGNFSAIPQTNFKRLLGYSSVSHAGYLLLVLGCAPTGGLGLTPSGIVAFYLATYLPMTFICFLFLSVTRAKGLNEDLSSLRGLARSHPQWGLAVAIALASLAGLPLTAGFIGKFFVIFATVLHGFYTSLLVAVAGAAVGFYYYFKIILTLYAKSEDGAQAGRLTFGVPAKVLAGLFVAAILLLGVYPNAVRNMLAAPTPVALSK